MGSAVAGTRTPTETQDPSPTVKLTLKRKTVSPKHPRPSYRKPLEIDSRTVIA